MSSDASHAQLDGVDEAAYARSQSDAHLQAFAIARLANEQASAAAAPGTPNSRAARAANLAIAREQAQLERENALSLEREAVAKQLAATDS